MGSSRGQRSTLALLAPVERREPERLLGKLGCDRRRAAVDRDPHCVVERGGDALVGSVLRESKVTSAE
jgi:hypothetical protein